MTTYRINAFLNKLQLIGVLSKTDTRNPTATDWTYPVPTLWINTASDSAYLLVHNSENAAVWTEIVPSESSFTQGNDALAIYDITVAVPGAPSAGDGYILSATGTRDVSWTNLGATYKDYVIYDGAAWKVSTPMGGSIVYVDSLKELFIYADDVWKSFHEMMPFDFQESVLSFADNTSAPPTEVTGDRYILDTTGGGVNAGWDGAAVADLVEFDGVTWHALTPSEGMMASVEDVDSVYIYVAGWSPLITCTSLVLNGDTGTAAPDGSGEMDLTGDVTSGIVTTGDNVKTLAFSASQASATQRGTLETATDAEAIAQAATDKALVPSNLAALVPWTVPNGGLGVATVTGILTGNGTSAVSGSAVTQYGVLLGGASNAVGSTTAGVAAEVLTSNGPGLDPTFQPTASTVSEGDIITQVYLGMGS